MVWNDQDNLDELHTGVRFPSSRGALDERKGSQQGRDHRLRLTVIQFGLGGKSSSRTLNVVDVMRGVHVQLDVCRVSQRSIHQRGVCNRAGASSRFCCDWSTSALAAFRWTTCVRTLVR